MEIVHIGRDQFKYWDNSFKLNKLSTILKEFVTNSINEESRRIESSKSEYATKEASPTKFSLTPSPNRIKDGMNTRGKGISPNRGRDVSPKTYQRANDMLNQEVEILKKSNKDIEVII